MDGTPTLRTHSDRQGPGGNWRFESCCVLGSRIGSLVRIGVEIGCIQCSVCLPKTCGLTSRHSGWPLVRIFPDTPKGNVIVEVASNTWQDLQNWDACFVQLSFASNTGLHQQL